MARSCLGLGCIALTLSCTYRLPPISGATLDGSVDTSVAIDAGAPLPCEETTEVESPSCPTGAGHCGRVRIALPSSPWIVGPRTAGATDPSSFAATGARTIDVDVFEVDVARYLRFEASGELGTPRDVVYPDGSSRVVRATRSEPEVGSDEPLCTARAGMGSLPINCVSWESAMAFCAFDGGRLPTIAELEYVRRWWPTESVEAPGLDGRRFPWGDEGVALHYPGVLPARFPQTRAPAPIDPAEGPRVGCLFGIAGGVREWLADASAELDDPCYTDGHCESAETDQRWVATGGWLDDQTNWLESSALGSRHPSEQVPNTGFRCVYDVP